MTASRREEGAALLIAIIAMLLLSALGAALILNSSSETMIAAHFRDGLEARYAAGALIERGVDDISGTADWTLLTGGVLRSSWVDGPPSGSRALADGSTIDLAQAVNLANCRKTAACTAAELIAVTSDRPWGANNPQWWPYAYGPLRNLLPGAIDSPFYVLLMVGAGIPAPDREVLALRAEAFGPRGAHAIVDAVAARDTNAAGGETDYNQPIGSTVQLLSWREVR